MKYFRAFERAVATDNHQTLNAEPFNVGVGPGSSGVGHEFIGTGGAQNGTTAVNNIGYRTQIHWAHVGFYKTAEPPLDTNNLQPVVNSFAHYSTDSGIHARGVAAAG